MRSHSVALTAVVLSLGVYGCGGNYGNTSSPTAPSGATTTAPAPGSAAIIDVVAINGSQSFSPNPSTIPAGQMVVWHNVDTITHRVVMDDRSIDTGNLDPGAFSAPMFLEATGSYHCTIHPVMVGTIKGE
jgi:plastocyanin